MKIMTWWNEYRSYATGNFEFSLAAAIFFSYIENLILSTKHMFSKLPLQELFYKDPNKAQVALANRIAEKISEKLDKDINFTTVDNCFDQTKVVC